MKSFFAQPKHYILLREDMDLKDVDAEKQNWIIKWSDADCVADYINWMIW